jgi:formylglycine-generating enzyme required for sulfatase activity
MHKILGAFLAGVLLLPLGSPLRGLTFSKDKPADDPVQRKDAILKLFAEEFIALTPGMGKHPESFVMGTEKGGRDDERPARKITFAKPFAMAKYEATQELYQAVMGKNPSKWKGPRNAIEMVSWQEANEFCEAVTKEMQKQKLLEEDEKIRLPSEAEWEYVCRAGTTSEYSFGNNLEELTKYCWYKANSKGHDPPVGKKEANPWGFYDMHGYNWEWCADTWAPTYEGAPADGSARADAQAKDRVIRGGSWADPAEASRSAFRHHLPAGARVDTVGFRCVKAKF